MPTSRDQEALHLERLEYALEREPLDLHALSQILACLHGPLPGAISTKLCDVLCDQPHDARLQALLERVLASSRWDRRRAAIHALADPTKVRWAPLLRKMARQVDPSTRKTIVETLGAMRDPGAEPLLLQFLENESAGIQLASIEVLRELGSPAAAEALHKASSSTRDDVRAAAKEARTTLLERFARRAGEDLGGALSLEAHHVESGALALVEDDASSLILNGQPPSTALSMHTHDALSDIMRLEASPRSIPGALKFHCVAWNHGITPACLGLLIAPFAVVTLWHLWAMWDWLRDGAHGLAALGSMGLLVSAYALYSSFRMLWRYHQRAHRELEVLEEGTSAVGASQTGDPKIIWFLSERGEIEHVTVERLRIDAPRDGLTILYTGERGIWFDPKEWGVRITPSGRITRSWWRNVPIIALYLLLAAPIVYGILWLFLSSSRL